jgi:hypothetical protein
MRKVNILTHYDPKKPIVISCDAYDKGISVLSHIIDGKERPVFSVSRALYMFTDIKLKFTQITTTHRSFRTEKRYVRYPEQITMLHFANVYFLL